MCLFSRGHRCAQRSRCISDLGRPSNLPVRPQGPATWPAPGAPTPRRPACWPPRAPRCRRPPPPGPPSSPPPTVVERAQPVHPSSVGGGRRAQWRTKRPSWASPPRSLGGGGARAGVQHGGGGSPPSTHGQITAPPAPAPCRCSGADYCRFYTLTYFSLVLLD